MVRKSQWNGNRRVDCYECSSGTVFHFDFRPSACESRSQKS
jgi:hypothetical protein